MEFEKWSIETVKYMAVTFARCNNEEEIEDVLRLYHSLWVEESQRRQSQANKVSELVRKLNVLSK